MATLGRGVLQCVSYEFCLLANEPFLDWLVLKFNFAWLAAQWGVWPEGPLPLRF